MFNDIQKEPGYTMPPSGRFSAWRPGTIQQLFRNSKYFNNIQLFFI